MSITTRLALLCTLLALPAAAQVRVALCECDSPPLLELTPAGKPAGGLVKDISDLIIKQMGDTPHYELLSRKRIDLALAAGSIDMVCFNNPRWTSLSHKLNWTAEIIPQVEQVLLDAKRAPTIKTVADLAGMRVGLINGFHYPALEGLITAEQIKPVYERDHHSNFRLLELGLVDAVVSADLQQIHHLRTRKSGKPLGLSPLTVSTTPTHCAVPKASPLRMDKVNSAVQQLKQQGAFDKLLQRYRTLPANAASKP